MTSLEKSKMNEWRIKLEFKKQDCWLGCYWTMQHRDLHIYICLIPCLPIHIIKFNHDKGIIYD